MPDASTAPDTRCPRCGARLSARAAEALLRARVARAEGRPVAVAADDPPFCGCCGLLIATDG
jgi:hypothetical protein